MPTPYIKKLAKEGKGSTKTLEKKWDKAKEAADKQGQDKNYAYITKIFQNMAHASAEDMDPERDGGLAQPGVTIQPEGKNAGGGGAGSSVMAKVRGPMKLNAAARIKQVKASTVTANPDEFANIADGLTELLGKPIARKPGFYTFQTEAGGRSFEIEIHDLGTDIEVFVDRKGKVKFRAKCDDALGAIKAVEQGIRRYAEHELGDARAARKVLEQFKRKPITIDV